jgi:hypothetical protein
MALATIARQKKMMAGMRIRRALVPSSICLFLMRNGISNRIASTVQINRALISVVGEMANMRSLAVNCPTINDASAHTGRLKSREKRTIWTASIRDVALGSRIRFTISHHR